MKPGARVLGIAESFISDAQSSTLAGVVVRASRVVDGFAFRRCAIGGTDATAAVVDLYRGLDREDVRYLLIAGIAPAWYNVVDLHRIHEAVDRPVLSVTFEESEGLEPALRDAFSGDALDRRLEIYRRQPPRRRFVVNDEPIYLRAVGIDDAAARDVIRTITPEGGRPEPVRVARLAARAGDEIRRE
jgi:endonuclease V-like protein UPF0215 family